MIKKIATITFSLLLLAFLATGSLFAQLSFERVAEIPFPEADINNGGCGNMVAGVDTDGDGKLEIFVVNDNWNDGPTELIPRIYKLETNGDDWEVVWHAVAPVKAQNTWPTLDITDLDKDGKVELTWGIVNNFAEETNPYRIVVYEHVEGDIYGVDDGTGTYSPNAKWTICDEDNANMRIVNWKITDIDEDGTDDIIFADRKGYFHFGIINVDNIPDNGDGSETWSVSQTSGDITYGGDNKWDVAVIGSSFYTFDEVVISKMKWTGSEWMYSELAPLPGGISFDAAQVCDLDGDGTDEIVTGEYHYGEDSRHIWLLQEEADTLKRTPLFDVYGEEYLNGGRLIGGDHGDIDGDGYMDFVFGSRFAGPPNAMLFLVSYRGGEITDPANYEFSILDSAYTEDGGIWNVISITDIDDDPEMEVLYTSSSTVGDLFGQNTQPIIVLNMTDTGVEKQVISVPVNFSLKQNYPNPFNPVTNISYSLDQTEKVELKIFNLQGKEVKTLVIGTRAAGSHVTQWDATNNLGQKVTSGVYLYTLKVGNVLESKRMILVK